MYARGQVTKVLEVALVSCLVWQMALQGWDGSLP